MESVLIEKNVFGFSQMESIEKGKLNRQRLKDLVSQIEAPREGKRFPHLYFFSPPGMGKTYNVLNHLKESGLRSVQISGNVSMFAFGIQLAVINHCNPEKHPIIVYVDDCDEILRTETACNTMKNVLDGLKTFVYEKSLASQWKHLSELQQAAIEHFQEEGTMGFKVPCDNMVFVFTSNLKLPVDDEVELARKKNQSKLLLLTNRNAIRSRCRVIDFDLTWAEQWGWIADVVLHTDCLDEKNVTVSEKQTILDFMWHNWDSLTERSLRLIQKMTDTMRDFPDTYKIIWEIDFLKRK